MTYHIPGSRLNKIKPDMQYIRINIHLGYLFSLVFDAVNPRSDVGLVAEITA